MRRLIYNLVVLSAFATAWPLCLHAQSDDMPLGDLARSLRKSQTPPSTVIDNDNLPAVMEEGETHRWEKSSHEPNIEDAVLKSIKAASPDVTCALSFNGQASKNPTDDLIKPQSLPETEMTKLDGPATIAGEALQVSVYNGTAWDLREITVGLTVFRRANDVATQTGTVKIIPAAMNSSSEKRSDITLLYHMKGTAPPASTTTFQAPLNLPISSDQEWHWAIVQAKGIPPTPAAEPIQPATIQAPN